MRESIVTSLFDQETTVRETFRGVESDVFNDSLDVNDNPLVYNGICSFKNGSECDSDKDFNWSKSLAERIERRDAIRDLAKVKAEAGESFYWRTYKSLNNCNLYPKVDDKGNPTLHNHTCSCSRCPVCGVVAQKKVYFNTMDAITRLIDLGKGPKENPQRWHWVTLTLRHTSKNHFVEANKFRKRFNKFKNDRYWRGLTSGDNAGCVWRMELTDTNGWAHYHVHFLLLTAEPMTTSKLESELKKQWGKHRGGYVRVKRVKAERTDIIEHNEDCINESGERGRVEDREIGMTKVLNELVKYAVKRNEISVETHLDYFQANYNRPMTGFIGVFKKLLATIDEWKETPEVEEQDVPEPPSRVHPVTGEVANLKEGVHSFPDLFRRAYKLKEWSALWCLRMLRYRQKYVAPGLIKDWIDTREHLKDLD